MKLKRIIALVLALALSVMLFSGCAAKQAEFNKYLDESFVDYVTSDTITLHYTLKNPEAYGITDMEPKIYDLTVGDPAETKAELEEQLAYLKGINPAFLTQEQKYILEMLIWETELEMTAEGLEYYGTYLDSISGLPSNMPINFAEYKFYTEKDVTDYIALLNQFPTLFEQALEYEQKRVELGLGLSDDTLDTVIKQCTDFISVIDDNYLILTFETRLNKLNLSAEKNADYIAQNKTAFETNVVSAYQKLAEGLEALKGTGKNNGGLSNFEHGKEYYEYLMHSYTGTDYTMSELRELLSQKLAYYAEQLYAVASSDWDAYDKYYEDGLDYGFDPDSYKDLPRAEATKVLEKICIDLLEGLQKSMLDYVPALPANTYTVNFVEESLEDSMSPAFYMTPPIDACTENVVYINLGSVDATTLHSTLSHEAYPGHLYQTVYFNTTDRHPIRAVMENIGYVEGWAVYMENYSYNMVNFGEYDKYFDELSQVSSFLWLAVYSRIDFGVNYDGWKESDVAACLESSYYNGEYAKELMDMVISSPVTPLKYFIGYLQMEEMQKSARNALGDNFDMVAFNKAILDIGPMPFFIVKEAVNSYVTEAQAAISK